MSVNAEWHRAHARACGCRKPPPKLAAHQARVVTSLDRPVGDARDATPGDPLLARVRELQALSDAA